MDDNNKILNVSSKDESDSSYSSEGEDEIDLVSESEYEAEEKHNSNVQKRILELANKKSMKQLLDECTNLNNEVKNIIKNAGDYNKVSNNIKKFSEYLTNTEKEFNKIICDFKKYRDSIKSKRQELKKLEDQEETLIIYNLPQVFECGNKELVNVFINKLKNIKKQKDILSENINIYYENRKQQKKILNDTNKTLKAIKKKFYNTREIFNSKKQEIIKMNKMKIVNKDNVKKNQKKKKIIQVTLI